MSYEKSTTRFPPIVAWLTGISIRGYTYPNFFCFIIGKYFFLAITKKTQPLFFVFHSFTMSIREGCKSFVPTLEIGKLRLKVVFSQRINRQNLQFNEPFSTQRYNKKHHFCWRPTLIFKQRNQDWPILPGEKWLRENPGQTAPDLATTAVSNRPTAVSNG